MVNISTIADYFKDGNVYMIAPIRLDQATVIVDPEKFVRVSIKLLTGKKRHKRERERFLPYYQRLLILYNLCQH